MRESLEFHDYRKMNMFTSIMSAVNLKKKKWVNARIAVTYLDTCDTCLCVDSEKCNDRPDKNTLSVTD